MSKLPLLFLLASAPALAQNYGVYGPYRPDDCRNPEGEHTTPCFFYETTTRPTGRSEPMKYEGSLPFASGPTPSAPFFTLYMEPKPAPAAVHKGGHHFEISAYYAIQSQFLSYQDHNSDGYKVTFAKQWNDLLGFEVRGSVEQYDLLKAGRYPGNNGTEAIAFGPRVQHAFGRLTPYGEFLIGALDQYEPGMSIGGVAGFKVRLTKHWYWTPVDGEYRYALLQTDSHDIGGRNPLRGRVELGTGGTFRF